MALKQTKQKYSKKNRFQYPSTPKEFQTFDGLKQLRYNGNMLTSEERSGIYWDHTKIVVEMADAYHVFARCLYFSPEMSDKYKENIEQYTKYYTDVICNIDIYLQED